MMLRIALSGLRAQVRRLVATLLAVVFGVAFAAGTLIFSDTARAGYVEAFARIATNVDVVVEPGDGGAAPLTTTQLAAVRSLPEVAAAEGRMVAPLALLDHRGHPVTNFGEVGVAVSTDGDASLQPYETTGGDPGPGQALLDTDTAERLGYSIGDRITVVDAAGAKHVLRMVGLLDFGVSGLYAGQSVVGLPAATLVELTGREDFREIAIRTHDGVDPEVALAAVAAAVGPDQRVISGEQWRDDLVTRAAGWLTPFEIFLLLFAAVSLVVAALVIYNTFAVLGALRVRQTALLRCVGATRRQIFGATLLESTLIGLIGGALGVVLGGAVSYGLVALLNSTVDFGIPVRFPVIGVGPVVTALVLGTLVTVAAALLPALRATRTLPVAALRDQPTASPGIRRAAVRAGCAILVTGLGVATTVVGNGEDDLMAGTALIVAGGVVTFLGLLVAAPLFIGPLCRLLGALPARLLGTPARLARANSRRNPGRTAITSASLMVGVGLISIFATVMSSVEVNTAAVIDRQYPVDFVAKAIRVGDEPATVPAGYADELRGRPEFDAVGQLRAATVTVDGARARVGAVDPASLGGLVRVDLAEGAMTDFTAGTAIVLTPPSRAAIGETLTITGARSTIAVRVVGSAPVLLPAIGNVDVLVAWSDFLAIADAGGDAAVVATTAPGVSPNIAQAALDELADRYPLVAVSGVAALRSDVESTMDSILALVAGLLLITIVIALFGITNTLSLSVVERTRESATVRALGLTRGQLRGTLLLEALLIAGAGVIVGLGFGLVYAAVLVEKVLGTIDPVLVLPWGWLGGLVALLAVTAVLTAALPARRAARPAIVAAMVET